MAKTQPIRDKEKVIEILKYLKKNNSTRDYLIFLTGVSTALRISEILSIKYSDIFNLNGSFKKYVSIICKGDKVRDITLSTQLKKEMKKYCKTNNISGHEFIFKSQKKNRLSRNRAFVILKDAAVNCGIENFGTHSMRKTFARRVYLDSGHDLGLVMNLLDHNDPKFTLRYIGIIQEDVDKVTGAIEW